MAKYADKAVKSLHAWFVAQLPAQLRAVETAESLATNALSNPSAYVKAFVPWDNRSPLLQVYDNAGQPISHRNHITVVDCTVAVTYNGGTDLEAAETFCRRYVTAMIQTIDLDETFGGLVTGAIWSDFDRGFAMTDDSSTRHNRALGVQVHVFDP